MNDWEETSSLGDEQPSLQRASIDDNMAQGDSSYHCVWVGGCARTRTWGGEEGGCLSLTFIIQFVLTLRMQVDGTAEKRFFIQRGDLRK